MADDVAAQGLQRGPGCRPDDGPDANVRPGNVGGGEDVDYDAERL